jgi:hypothetical protein
MSDVTVHILAKSGIILRVQVVAVAALSTFAQVANRTFATIGWPILAKIVSYYMDTLDAKNGMWHY